jgi:predicted secreted protein
MIKNVIIGAALVALTACGGGLDQSSPEGTVQAIFDAATSGDYSNLKNLCHEDLDNDGDTRRVCECEDAKDKFKEQFNEAFAKGSVVDSKIDGEEAEVNFVFGKEGKKKETMKLKQVDGKWYLYSF